MARSGDRRSAGGAGAGPPARGRAAAGTAAVAGTAADPYGGRPTSHGRRLDRGRRGPAGGVPGRAASAASSEPSSSSGSSALPAPSSAPSRRPVPSATSPASSGSSSSSAAIVAFAIVGRTFRRTAFALDDLADAAERVEAGDYSARVDEPLRATRPIRDLVRGFNAMAARLEANETQRQSLLADVSHELRTPLAVVQGNIEAMLDGVHAADEDHLGAILDETKILARLVDDLRTIALSDAGALPLHREPTDLAILAADTAASFGPTAEAGGVDLTVDVADDVPLLDVDPGPDPGGPREPRRERAPPHAAGRQRAARRRAWPTAAAPS